MAREISAGGVVVRNRDGVWWMAAIELPTEPTGGSGSDNRDVGPDPSLPKPSLAKAANQRSVKPRKKPVLCLPKGLVDSGEKALEAALREVREETGITAAPIVKLADIKYVYVRSWGDRERVFKIVSFYLLRYESGRIDNVSEEMRVEVARAKWIRLDEAPKLLAYRGEKQMARQAIEYIKAHEEEMSGALDKLS